MRILIKLLCLLPGFAFASRSYGQQDYLKQQAQQQLPPITISSLSWSYPKNGATGPAAVNASVTNNGSKPIKSVKLLIIAKNKKGTILQSQGTTIKQLTATDTISTGETKHLSFRKGYDNPDINTLELKEAIIEFFNGALEKIPGNAENVSAQKMAIDAGR